MIKFGNDENIPKLTPNLWTNLLVIILTIDIILNFFKCYFNKGIAIYDRNKIAKHYLKNVFILDAIVLLTMFIQIYFL